MKEKNIKVILSTNGPLHLIKSAEFLSRLVDIRVIQGWIPSWWNRWLLGIASKIQKRNIYITIKKRTPECLNGCNRGLAIPDMFYWGCRLFKIASVRTAAVYSARLYGKLQQKYLKDADVYHVRSGSGGNGAIEKARERGMKVVVDHSIAHPAFMERQLRDEYEKNGERFDLGLDNPFWAGIVEECKRGDMVLVNSDFVRDTFVANGFDASKIRVAYLGVRNDFFALKKDYALKDDTLRILFTGSFGFRKGAEYILRALCELDKKGFKYEMTAVGSDGSKSIINQYCPKHLKLVNTVPQEALKSYLAESDVYLFPSLCEGCASSGMEAMAAGLPVITTWESGLPIEHGKDGLIIPSKQVSAIVDSLEKIASDKTLRERMGKTAADKIATNYTWEMYAENVLGIYKELLYP